MECKYLSSLSERKRTVLMYGDGINPRSGMMAKRGEKAVKRIEITIREIEHERNSSGPNLDLFSR